MNKEETDTIAACKAEVSNFFLDTVKPFLEKLEPAEKRIASDWSMKIMTMENYSIAKQYLMPLTWMIIKGTLVPPFDKKLSEDEVLEIENILMEHSIEEIMRRIQNQQRESKDPNSLSANQDNEFIKQLTPTTPEHDGLGTSCRLIPSKSSSSITPQMNKWDHLFVDCSLQKISNDVLDLLHL